MKLMLPVAAALAVAAAAPAPASADIPVFPAVDCTQGVGAVQLGFGGYFSDCWAGFQVTRYFENALDVSDLYWFNGMPTRNTGGTNDPLSAPGTFLFDNDCGSNGSKSLPGAFCVPQTTSTFAWTGTGELVFGLHKAENGGWWLYSGDDQTTGNDPAPPHGIQNYLWYISGGQFDGNFLLGWEDLNSGCLSASSGSNTGDDQVTDPGTINGDDLDVLLASCNNNYTPGTVAPSDDDYNDFYVIVNPLTETELTDITEVVPEPMTMTLLATGLVGLGGASLRRRRNQK